jgi:hypothetical protein
MRGRSADEVRTGVLRGGGRVPSFGVVYLYSKFRENVSDDVKQSVVAVRGSV